MQLLTNCKGNTLHYRQIDVRDVSGLNSVIKNISDAQGRLDGLIAAAGIQQETPAIDYTQADSNMMFEVNVTGMCNLSKLPASYRKY